MMFENITVSFLSIIGIILITLALLEYRRTKNETTKFGLLSVGLGLFGLSFIVHYIMVDYTDTKYLFTGGLSLVIAVLCGFKEMYELGTGNPRTFLPTNQEIHIIGSAVSKHYNHTECFFFKATTGDVNNFFTIPIVYAIPKEKFPEENCPKENSTFKTDEKGNII